MREPKNELEIGDRFQANTNRVFGLSLPGMAKADGIYCQSPLEASSDKSKRHRKEAEGSPYCHDFWPAITQAIQSETLRSITFTSEKNEIVLSWWRAWLLAKLIVFISANPITKGTAAGVCTLAIYPNTRVQYHLDPLPRDSIEKRTCIWTYIVSVSPSHFYFGEGSSI